MWFRFCGGAGTITNVNDWLDPDEQAAWRAYVMATTTVHRLLDRALKPHGLSTEDYGILALLSEAPEGELRLGELAQQIRVPKPFLTYRFQRLEQTGLVERRQCSDDARGVFGVLTALGRRTVEEVAPVHVASVRRLLLDALSRDQVLALGGIMDAVLVGIDEGDLYPGDDC